MALVTSWAAPARAEPRLDAGPCGGGDPYGRRPDDAAAPHRPEASAAQGEPVGERSRQSASPWPERPTLLLQQGVPARMGMQIVGHSQISLTLGTYSHVVPELAQEAAERIDRVLWAP